MLFIVLVKELGKAGQAGVHLLLAPAGLDVQISPTAGAQPLAVLGAEIFGVHLQHEGVRHERAHVQAVPLQKNNVLL